MTELIICIAVGIAIGCLDKINMKTRKILEKISLFSLFLMLWCLGAKIGCDRELLAKLDVIGLKSLELAFFVIVGSVIGVWIVIKIFSFIGMDEIENEEVEVEKIIEEAAEKRSKTSGKATKEREGK